MLQLEGLVLDAGTVPFDLQCPPASLTVVLGRNLSGKSALCRVIAGLDTPSAGRVLVDGLDQTEVPLQQRPVAMVYQAFVNYPHWTVAQNIASPLRARGTDRQMMRGKVEEIAESVGLQRFLDRLPQQLSGGQQQRLAIARALAKDARVLVMDEPFVNLDYKLRETLREELVQLVHTRGICVVYTTSDPAEALALGDQLVLVAGQGPLQAGDPMHLYRAPASIAAADLLSEPGINRLEDASTVLAVRPEHVELEAPPAENRSLTMTVEDTQTNGSQTYVYGDVLGHPWVVRLEGLQLLQAGERRKLYVRDADLLRFSD